MHILVCLCMCLSMALLKCCSVSAGVRGSPQSGAKGLRSWLDHRHQSAGGNPHLSAVSCATLEGKPTHKCVSTDLTMVWFKIQLLK